MADDLESLRNRAKRDYRAMAEAGDFDRWPRFKSMCLSPEGFEPSLGMLLLAPHAEDSRARHLIAACQNTTSRWNPQLKATEVESAADGPPVFIINQDPIAVSPEVYRKWEAHFLAKRWRPPKEKE